MKNLKNSLAAIIVFVLFSATATASTKDSTGVLPVEDPITVKYLGNDGDYLLFQVEMKSTDAKHTSLEIFDKSAGQLYSTNIKSNYKVQTMKIEKTYQQQLDFNLVIDGKTYSKSFSIMEPIALAVNN